MTLNAKASPRPGRNVGIDLLRVVAMFQVLVLHTLGRGEVLGAVRVGTPQYRFAWLLEMGAYGAANIFALISGYVSYTDEEKRVNFSNYIMLWLQVVFYSVGATLWFQWLHPDWVAPIDRVQMFLPVTFDLYWYFTAYTGVFLLMPILNAGIRHCSAALIRRLFFLMILLFSVFATFTQRFTFSGGYSFAWVLVLYVLGAAVKKGGVGQRMKAWQAGLGVLLCWAATWGWMLWGPTFTFWGFKVTPSTVASYLSPPVLIGSVFYLICFSKLRFPPRAAKVVSFLSAGSFAVYLLNCQKFVYTNWLGYRFQYLASRGLPEMALHVFGFSLLFLLGAILLDHVRIALFRLLRLRKLADRLVALVRRGAD